MDGVVDVVVVVVCCCTFLCFLFVDDDDDDDHDDDDDDDGPKVVGKSTKRKKTPNPNLHTQSWSFFDSIVWIMRN